VPDRRRPRYRELRALLRPARFEPNPTARRLGRALTIGDLRAAARRRVPRSVFDYADGGADDEISLLRARQLYRDLELRPSVLRDVTTVSLATPMLGRPAAAPFAFAPTGFTRMMHTAGERAVARVAQRHEIPYALSTVGTTSLEDVAAAAPDGRRWFQLYMWKDRSISADLMSRAKAAGYEALVLTVDCPIAGTRRRDVRNGFTIPPSLTLSTFLGAALHPSWLVDFLTSEPLTFASLGSWDGSGGANMVATLFDAGVDITGLEWVRARWDGPLVVKGIQSVADAHRMVDAGADALVVSNHGGRQLDRAPTPLRVLPDIVDAVGERVEVYCDSAITSGADIAAAIALGARATLVGRAYLYGLMAGGERGVDRAAEILTRELRHTMQLLGVTAVHELERHHVRLP
jgi:L-lactate dehydrogenase (cytochrome)